MEKVGKIVSDIRFMMRLENVNGGCDMIVKRKCVKLWVHFVVNAQVY